MINIFYKTLLVILGSGIFINVSSQEYTINTSVNNIENIRGLVKPRKRAVLSSAISGQITEIRYDIGERFSAGDILIRFDCSRFEADLASANAKYNAQSKQYENNKKLLELNAISDIDVELSLAEMEIARAEATIKRIIAQDCSITAPYNGRVIDVIVNEYETVSSDQELISVLDDQVLEIEIIVPSNWLIDLTNGEEFIFSVDETGRDYLAKIVRIGAIVDPVSQTVRLIGEFVDNADDVLSGMSGTAVLN